MSKPEKAETGSFGKRIAGGAALVLGAQAAKMVIRMTQVILLARLLTPEDLGLVAAVSPVLAFVAVFQNVGLQQALIQRETIDDRLINQAFWFLLLIGGGSMIFVIAIAPGVALFYDDGRITDIVLALSPVVMLQTLASLPGGLLARELKFRHVTAIDIVSSVVMLVSGVGAALAGFGYWALVIAENCRAGAFFLVSALCHPWRPLRPDFRIDRGLFSFGANLTGANFLNFFNRNLDNVLIGKVEGPVALGYYDRAYKLLLYPIRNGVQPLNRVAVPGLSRLQADLPRFRRAYLKFASATLLAILPGIIAAIIATRETVLFLFGEQWLPVVPIFALLGFVALVQPQQMTNAWIFIALGKTKQMLQMTTIYSVVIVMSFIIGVRWGAIGVAGAYALVSVAGLPFRWWVVSRTSPVTFWDNVQLLAPFAIGLALSSIAYNAVLASGVTTRVFPLLLIALTLSYSITLITALGFKPTRDTMALGMRSGLNAVGRIRNPAAN